MTDDLLSRIEQSRRAAAVVDAEERLSNRERFPLVTEMVDELRSQPDRSAVAVIDAGGGLTGTNDGQEAVSRTDRGWTLRLDDEGMLSIPALGARLIAQQLPEREAADLAALLALAAQPTTSRCRPRAGTSRGRSTPMPPVVHSRR